MQSHQINSNIHHNGWLWLYLTQHADYSIHRCNVYILSQEAHSLPVHPPGSAPLLTLLVLWLLCFVALVTAVQHMAVVLRCLASLNYYVSQNNLTKKLCSYCISSDISYDITHNKFHRSLLCTALLVTKIIHCVPYLYSYSTGSLYIVILS